MKMSKIEHFDKSTIVSDFLIFLIFKNLSISSHTSEVCCDDHLNFIVENVTDLFSKHTYSKLVKKDFIHDS